MCKCNPSIKSPWCNACKEDQHHQIKVNPDFEKVKEAIDLLEGSSYLQAEEGHWYASDKNKELYLVDSGEVYTYEINGCINYTGTIISINGDNGCGETITVALLPDMQLTFDEFMEKYED